MDFLEYLESKKIDASSFKKAEAELYSEWEVHFSQMHPKSFTSQKLYLINDLRRRFLLKEKVVDTEVKTTPKVVKPKVMAVKKPGIKIPIKK